MRSDAYCDVEDGPVVSGGVGAVGGGTEGDESETEVLSTSTIGTGVRLFLYRLKPLKITQLQEPYNSLIPMSLWINWLAKIIFS